jgi:DNA-binding transcriptional ArsR family regulator
MKELGEEREKFLDLFGCKGRFNVLYTLTLTGPLNIGALSRKTGLNHGSVSDHCDVLADNSLVCEQRYGRIRILEVNFRSLELVFKRRYGIQMKIDQIPVLDIRKK